LLRLVSLRNEFSRLNLRDLGLGLRTKLSLRRLLRPGLGVVVLDIDVGDDLGSSVDVRDDLEDGFGHLELFVLSLRLLHVGVLVDLGLSLSSLRLLADRTVRIGRSLLKPVPTVEHLRSSHNRPLVDLNSAISGLGLLLATVGNHNRPAVLEPARNVLQLSVYALHRRTGPLHLRLALGLGDLSVDEGH
jgi:hypothetical protein